MSTGQPRASKRAFSRRFRTQGRYAPIACASRPGASTANQLRSQGREFDVAIREAARARLRPILMTSIATALGAFPLVIGSGPGSGGRRAIGIVVFTGVLVATFLTLFVVPVAYSLFARRTAVPGELDRQVDAIEAETSPAVGALSGR